MTGATDDDAARIRASGLFDEAWYLAQYPDVAALGMDPVEHYLWIGATLGRDPSPRFNIDTYMAMRTDVEESGFWDEKWYLSQYYDAYTNAKKRRTSSEYFSPLDYYLTEGWMLGHQPSTLLPIEVDQIEVGSNKVSYFLNRLRFEGYHFERNIWIPSEERVSEYIAARSERSTKRVLYTCINGNCDKLMQPYFIADDWDYVCFTDDPHMLSQGFRGVWEMRPMNSEVGLSGVRANRWHKMNPHALFSDYEESIYVDGNINVLSSYIFDLIQNSNTKILLPQHFVRGCIYQEIDALLLRRATSEEDKELLKLQRKFFEEEGFPKGFGLSENNLIYRRHHDAEVVGIMNDWWATYQQYSSRDQASLAYVFWKRNRSLNVYMFANCRVNYRDFAVVRHAKEASGNLPVLTIHVKQPPLTPAFSQNNVAAVFSTNEAFIPYLGLAIFSLLEQITPDYNYDIVILAKGIPESAFEKILRLSSTRANVSIRIYDTSSLLEALPTDIFHVDGYVPVETYNKCFITEILSGYDRCVYLDSDIIVLDDISKLHNTELNGRSIGASANVANINAAYCKKEIKGRRFDEYLANDLGVANRNHYFQAGVLVLDLKKLRAMNLGNRTIETLNRVKRPIFYDQCIFNSIFAGDVTFFSTRWNHVWYIQQYSYLRGSLPDEIFFDYAHGRVNPQIIHYASKDKPQSKLGWALSETFWDCAYRSPFFDDIRNDVISKDNEVARLLSTTTINGWYKEKPRVLVHVHLFYLDQLDVMVRALRNICDCKSDLFVTMVERSEAVEKALRSEWQDVRIIIVPNVGYDVYPFLHVLNQVRLANYDFILKIHTKNARVSGQDEVYGVKVPGYSWRDELLDAIVGSKEVFAENLARLAANRSIGCVGAQRFIFSTLKNAEERNYSLAEWRAKCGVQGGSHYVGGSMFLARAFPFERLKSLGMEPDDFRSAHMGTKDHKNKAHIVERLFGIVVESEGFEIVGGDS